MRILSPDFEDGQPIPKKFTCEGEDINPALEIADVPKGAKSLVLIVDDPDAPAKVWEHWTVIDIPPQISVIKQASVPGTQLANDFGSVEWGGPCPPPGKVHNYRFKLYALSTLLSLAPSSAKESVEEAMKGHILEEAVLTGTYKR